MNRALTLLCPISAYGRLSLRTCPSASRAGWNLSHMARSPPPSLPRTGVLITQPSFALICYVSPTPTLLFFLDGTNFLSLGIKHLKIKLLLPPELTILEERGHEQGKDTEHGTGGRGTLGRPAKALQRRDPWAASALDHSLSQGCECHISSQWSQSFLYGCFKGSVHPSGYSQFDC